MPQKTRVLFLCTHNAVRSQMAEGLLRARHGDRFEAASAGTQPSRIDSRAIEAMEEIGIDISAQRSKSEQEFLGQRFDFVVTLCDGARTACPVFPGTRRTLHAPFPDPASEPDPGRRTDAFRSARDQLSEWIEATFGSPR